MTTDLGMPGTRVDRNEVGEPARLDLARRLRRDVRGDVAFDQATRSVYATDSSNYRQVPLGVVFPRDAADVEATLAACREADAAVLGRGGGTSLAGQGCNVAVVLDTSRYMNRILEIDPERRLARVEPGVVLDDLRAECEKHGLTFGPDPATHAWCTLGGMIGNNSCGTHALYAGKTVDNVARLRVLTYDGVSLDVGPTTSDEVERLASGTGREAEIYRGLRDLSTTYADLVRERYPDIPRRVSGLNLDALLPEQGFHVARALVGSESTCVLVTEATLHLVPSPTHRRMVVLGYPDVFTAADHVPAVLAHKPLGLECVDEELVRQMQHVKLNVSSLDMLPGGGGWLIAELGDDDPAVADAAADVLVQDAPGGATCVRYDDPADQKRVWTVRESALGATARAPGELPRYEGWEDAAVPPERLGEYLRGLVALWEDYGYSGALYGHAGQGCVHTRNDFDLSSEKGLADFREFCERAADLTVALGGSLSGEHGDGQARGELLDRMYGPDLVQAFREFKAVWDPAGRMNPGKVVDPFPLDTNLQHGPGDHESTVRPTHFAFARDSGSLQGAADRCVGVGRCRRTDAGVMCPSYRATSDEIHSTRGRAKMLSEMFRGEVTPETWRNDDVKEALDLCLACKGCKVECPTGVDMATYKAEFMAHYYRGRARPRSAYALGLLPWAARLATRVPGLANSALGSRVTGRLLKRAAGVTTEREAPEFSRTSFRRWWKKRPARRGTGAARATAGAPDAGRVVLWPDTFTDAFASGTGRAAVDVLEDAGCEVVVPSEWACCGRTLYDFGMLDRARRTLTRVLDVLQPHLEAGTPVVVLEPSCLAVFVDELPDLLRDDPRAARLASLARSLPAYLVEAGYDVPALPEDHPRHALVQVHCHQHATVGTSPDRQVMAALGLEAEVLDTGCCGLAGSFGFRAEHDDVSRRVAADKLLPALEAADPETLVLADGFSCATQVEQLAGRRTAHLADLLATAVAARRQDASPEEPPEGLRKD